MHLHKVEVKDFKLDRCSVGQNIYKCLFQYKGAKESIFA